MAQTVVQFDTPVVHTDGAEYLVRACGRERDDALWEGWLEFVDTATGEVVRTVRETTQPNLADLKYWATGLTAVYLQGALERTLGARPQASAAAVSPPAYDGPAPRARRERLAPNSVLNPFSVYAKNPDLLARELSALRAFHLRQIIRDYELVDEESVRLEEMTEPELGSLILERVRDLHA